MTYNRPADVTYTEMAIWIDNNIYQEQFDEVKAFQYMYHLAIMLARNGKWFSCSEDYDKYGLVMATRVFNRMTSPKQYQYKEDGTPKLQKIKSVLNFMKNVARPWRADFKKSYYMNTQGEYLKDEVIQLDTESALSNQVDEALNGYNICNFSLYLKDIIKTAKHFFETIPTKRFGSEGKKIYISVMLSFLNYITVPNKVEQDYEQQVGGIRKSTENIKQVLERQQLEDNIILWHLDDKYKSYVFVLLKELKHIIAQDLSQILGERIMSDMRDFLLASMMEDKDDEDED